MQIAGNPRALAHSLLEAYLELMREVTDAIHVRGQGKRDHNQRSSDTKLPHSPPRRLDGDPQCRAGLTPGASVGRALYTKVVNPGRQRRVTCHAAVATHFLPIGIETLEPVSISVGARAAEAQRGELYCEAALTV